MATKKRKKTAKRKAKRPASLRKAVAFFYKYAGWSYDPKKETKAQGRRRCAVELAKAEHEASQRGWTYEWEHDESEYQMGDAETEMPSEVLCCVLRDQHDPDRNYGRVVEAELAYEALP